MKVAQFNSRYQYDPDLARGLTSVTLEVPLLPASPIPGVAISDVLL